MLLQRLSRTTLESALDYTSCTLDTVATCSSGWHSLGCSLSSVRLLVFIELYVTDFVVFQSPKFEWKQRVQ